MNDIRNKIIHHYFGVDYDIVWDTGKTNIPLLKESIEEHDSPEFGGIKVITFTLLQQ